MVASHFASNYDPSTYNERRIIINNETECPYSAKEIEKSLLHYYKELFDSCDSLENKLKLFEKMIQSVEIPFIVTFDNLIDAGFVTSCAEKIMRYFNHNSLNTDFIEKREYIDSFEMLLREKQKEKLDTTKNGEGSYCYK